MDSLPTVDVNSEQLFKLAKAGANGSGAGVSGWNSDLLFDICKDPECLDGIREITEDIINDTMSDATHPGGSTDMETLLARFPVALLVLEDP